ncbi:ribonuclease HII [Paeniglutamicibacter sp. ABSL32-1]|uniref:ribonuclease HII n=1 Tax=Paeniglutamicibacter quisquiliarum TaxID=2849498 RepID=UPI001C2D91CC|nr:ribonuclease HII [Paeniglutamicibacter quisquiliarum]MBV1778736.1 ribonuclease HII [Paeniglutamicibacter quisquiliarum]
MASTPPTLQHELALAAAGGHRFIGAADEVGRGSLAGPVSVGYVVIDPATATELPGVRDSKLVPDALRHELVPAIKDWAAAWGVGHASAAEIDALGLVPALRLAGLRAATAAHRGQEADAVLLDGNLDWLSATSQPTLLDSLVPGFGDPEDIDGLLIPVHTLIKGDLLALSIAAASILAKVERDDLMDGYDRTYPAYGWIRNKGYGTAAHRAGIAEHGACEYHRKTWQLTPKSPGVNIESGGEGKTP